MEPSAGGGFVGRRRCHGAGRGSIGERVDRGGVSDSGEGVDWGGVGDGGEGVG